MEENNTDHVQFSKTHNSEVNHVKVENLKNKLVMKILAQVNKMFELLDINPIFNYLKRIKAYTISENMKNCLQLTVYGTHLVIGAHVLRNAAEEQKQG